MTIAALVLFLFFCWIDRRAAARRQRVRDKTMADLRTLRAAVHNFDIAMENVRREAALLAGKQNDGRITRIVATSDQDAIDQLTR